MDSSRGSASGSRYLSEADPESVALEYEALKLGDREVRTRFSETRQDSGRCPRAVNFRLSQEAAV